MKHIKPGHRRQSLFQGFAWQSMEEHLPENLVADYKEAFQTLDQDQDGKISLSDLSMVVFSIGKRLTEIELLEFVSRVVDLQGLNVTDNFLGFPEFLAIIAFIITDCVSEEEATRIFREFDKDGDGFISEIELRNLMLRLGDDVSDQEVQEMMKVADRDGDGKVSLKEFIYVLNSARTSSDSATDQQMSMPRILIENEETPVAENSYKNLSEFSCITDRSPLPTVVEECSRSERELHLTRRNSINDRRPSLCYKNTARKKGNVRAWIKQTETDSERAENVISNPDNSTSSTSSITSSPMPTDNNIRKRRKSSISRTLRHGRDAIIATARTLRRISR